MTKSCIIFLSSINENSLRTVINLYRLMKTVWRSNGFSISANKRLYESLKYAKEYRFELRQQHLSTPEIVCC